MILSMKPGYTGRALAGLAGRAAAGLHLARIQPKTTPALNKIELR